MSVGRFGDTHYNWREDVARLVRRFEQRFKTKANTYVDHPTGFGLDDRSVDFWAPRGRGVSISPRTGQAIFRRLRHRERPPDYRWIIWKGHIYYGNGGVEPYDDPLDQHFDHVHVTFW